MRASFGNCATVLEPSIWPLMPTPMAAANRQRSASPEVSGNEAYTARLVSLPEGHDPNSFFVSGGNAQEFQRLLEEACL